MGSLDTARLENIRQEYKHLSRLVRKSCSKDRDVWWAKKAVELEKHSIEGNSREAFGLFRQLTSRPGRSCGALRDKSGKPLDNPNDIMTRWTEHFKEVLKANVDDSEPVLESSLPAECPTDSLSLSDDQRGLLYPPSLEEVISWKMESTLNYSDPELFANGYIV